MLENPVIFKRTALNQIGGILADPKVINTREAYDALRGIVNSRPDSEALRESLIAAMTLDSPKGSHDRGAVWRNRFATQGQRDTVYTSHYPRPVAGATVALTYTDTDTHDIYVLLARKLKDLQKPELGLKDEYIMVGGHMEPHLPGTADQGPFDFNLAATAKRELKEETGLELPSGYQPVSLILNSDYGYSNTPEQHTINDYRHVSLFGPGNAMPKLNPSDDIAELLWVNAKDIQTFPENGRQPFASELSRYYVQTPGGTVMRLRDDHGEALQMAVDRALKLENERMQTPPVPANQNDPASWSERVRLPSSTAARTLQ